MSHKVINFYPDHKLVHNIPGSEIPFTLKKYKEEIDKPYSRISLSVLVASDEDSADEDVQSKRTEDKTSKVSKDSDKQSIPTVIVDTAPETGQDPCTNKHVSRIVEQVCLEGEVMATKL